MKKDIFIHNVDFKKEVIGGSKIYFYFLKNWIWFFFFLLSVALPLIWLRGDYLYFPEEGFFANYQIIFDKYLYAWNDKLNYGAPAAPNNFSLLIPAAIFFKLFNYFGLSNHASQVIYLQVFLFTSFVAISYFLRIFTLDKKIILLGSLVYVFNFYFFQALSYSAKMSQIVLCPLFFYWMYRYLETKKFKYAVYNFFGIFFLQNIFCNLPQLVSTFLSYIIAILYFLNIGNIRLKKFFSIYTKKILLFFILLLPIILFQGIVYYFSTLENYDIVRKYSYFTALASPLNLIMQFRGSWWELASLDNVPYSHWRFFYDNKVILVLSFIIFLFPFITIFKDKKISKDNLFWAFVFLFFVFLASGTAISYSLFSSIYEKIPFFYIFREPWAKFMIFVILSFSVLLILAFKKITNKKIYYVFLIVILIKALPFFSSNFFDHSNSKWKKNFIKTPQYWNNYFDWSRNNKDKHILALPYSREKSVGFEYIWYKENLGNANASMTAFFDLSNSVRENFHYSNISRFNAVAKSFDESGSVDFVKLGTVDYLLEEKDLIEIRKDKAKQDMFSIKKYFQEQPELSFGDKLFLYRIKPEFYLSKIYIPESVFISNRLIENISRPISSQLYDMNSSIFLKDQNQLNQAELEKIKGFHKSDLLSYNFHKINPTKYKVSIKNASGIFPLVFLNNYDRLWKIYMDKKDNRNNIFQTWFKKSIDDNQNHLMVNGYANSWVIDTNKICAQKESCMKNSDGTYDFEIVVEFWPQRLFYIGIFISGMTFLGCISYLAYDFKKRHNKKKKNGKNNENN